MKPGDCLGTAATQAAKVQPQTVICVDLLRRNRRNGGAAFRHNPSLALGLGWAAADFWKEFDAKPARKP